MSRLVFELIPNDHVFQFSGGLLVDWCRNVAMAFRVLSSEKSYSSALVDAGVVEAIASIIHRSACNQQTYTQRRFGQHAVLLGC